MFFVLLLVIIFLCTVRVIFLSISRIMIKLNQNFGSYKPSPEYAENNKKNCMKICPVVLLNSNTVLNKDIYNHTKDLHQNPFYVNTV